MLSLRARPTGRSSNLRSGTAGSPFLLRRQPVDVAGLELEALFGSFDRKPVDDDRREYVFVARR
jgi:hypothetical protein